MIYITYRNSVFYDLTTIKNVWEVKNNTDVETSYKDFMLNKAKELDLNINPHYINIVLNESYNNHLTNDEFVVKTKQWKKIVKQWNVDKYIADVLKGKKLGFKNLYL